MTNIPTELLRTLIAVADLRSFTRAAQSLGVTQPAISAQIKRLQVMLAAELFDKSAPGVTLTAKGEVVVNYARRLLSINDQLLEVTTRSKAVERVRIGIPIDYFEGVVLETLVAYRASHPDFHMQVSADASESLLRDLRRGEFDLVVASDVTPTANARRSWLEHNAWGAASRAVFETDGPIPLAVLGETSLSRRLSVTALEQAGRAYEIAYVGGSLAGLVQAAAAGLGVACWAKRVLRATSLQVFDSAPPHLPPISDVHGGVYLREGVDNAALDELADMIAAAVSSQRTEDLRARIKAAVPLVRPASDAVAGRRS